MDNKMRPSVRPTKKRREREKEKIVSMDEWHNEKRQEAWCFSYSLGRLPCARFYVWPLIVRGVSERPETGRFIRTRNFVGSAIQLLRHYWHSSVAIWSPVQYKFLVNFFAPVITHIALSIDSWLSNIMALLFSILIHNFKGISRRVENHQVGKDATCRPFVPRTKQFDCCRPRESSISTWRLYIRYVVSNATRLMQQQQLSIVQ